MSLDHQLSERVYRRLKDDVLSGALGCARLNLPTLQTRYSSSATPIREGLLRLVGENLIDLLPQGGFGVHRPDRTELRGLYELNLRLLSLAATWRREALSRSGDSEEPISNLSPPFDALFLSLAKAVNNPTLAEFIGRINDRLHCNRAAENIHLHDAWREYEILKEAVNEADVTTIVKRVRAYHRRRIKRLDVVDASSGKIRRP